MKHLLLTLLIIMASSLCFAKEGEVILTRYYTQNESNIIPKKTDQFQVQNITLSTNESMKEVVTAINQMVSTINEEDFEHYVFSLYVYLNSNNNYSLQIEAHDPMNDPKTLRENMLGVAKIGYRYFIVQKMPALESLQKQLFVKSKGKTKFIREFELVQFARKETRTSLAADLDNGALTIKEFEVCNINKLENPSDAVKAELDYNESK